MYKRKGAGCALLLAVALGLSACGAPARHAAGVQGRGRLVHAGDSDRYRADGQRGKTTAFG